jgi:hypothetical protein
MHKTIILLSILLLSQTLFAAPQLTMFDRFPSSKGGPDTRGAIWYNEDNHQIFVAGHGKGLWKIDECGNEYGQTTNKDNGIWDIGHNRDYIFAIGKSGLFIYDEDGNYLNSLNGIQGEGIYVKGDYAYIVNEKEGISIVNVENINKPFIVDTVMKGEKFSQIRGGTIKQKIPFLDKEISVDMLYISSLDGKLYLFEREGSKIYYKDDITIFSGSEARKIFAGKKELVYVNSNFGELAVVKVDKNNLKLHQAGSWKSSEAHGKGQQSPAAGGVFVKEIKDGKEKKTYAIITAADGNSDGYLYWLDVTDPENITKVDSLHDTQESYGFNDIWINDTRIYLASHDGFAFMAMEGTRNTPLISIRQEDGTYFRDGNVTQEAKNAGDTKTFYAKIENSDESHALKTRLNAPSGTDTWEYKYYRDDTDITEKIISQNGYIVELSAGDSFQIKIEATPLSKTASDTIITITAANKETKEVCGKPLESHGVNAIVKFSDGTAFSCDGTAYIFTSHSSKEEPTDVYITDIVSGNFELKSSDINPANINAIGYNITDNYIWGYDKVTEEVKRIDKNYHVKAYKITGLPEHGYHAGDVSADGILYLFTKYYDGGKKIYKVDLNPSSSEYLKMVGDITLPKKIYTSDFAFHPTDNMIYYAGNSNLFKIDPETGKIYDLGNLGLGEKKIFIGTFFDDKGYFYIQENKGTVYRIDITDPAHPNAKAEKFSTFPVTSYSDGARCAKAPMSSPTTPPECKLSFPGAISSTKDIITLGNNVTIKGNSNGVLTTKMLKTGAATTCDSKKCQKSNTLAQKFSFKLQTGNGEDGVIKKRGSFSITKNKNYQKIYIETNSVVTIENAIVKIQKEFQLNSATTLNIKGNVTIHVDKFQLNQKGIINIDGTLKVIANEFYINSNAKINNNKPQNFIVLAKKIIDFNNAGKVNGIFYSEKDLKLDNTNNIYGALTASFIDINNYTTVDYSADAVNSFCNPSTTTSNTSYFNVWDQDESIDHQIIKTKIVDDDINLTFASLNQAGDQFKATDIKNIKVALFSPTEQLTIWHTLIPETSTHMDITFNTNDFAYFNQQHKAFKEVKAIMQYKDKNGTIQYATSSDTFAIRPKRYDLVLDGDPSDFVAGKPFDITVKAVGATGQIVSNYNESKDVYDFVYSETKSAQGCQTGELNITKADFSGGIAVAKARYNEVGILKLKVYEIENSNSEYAHIDKADTTERYINPDQKESQEFNIGKLVWHWNLQNGANHYTFFSSNPLKMGATLDIEITTQSTNGENTENFHKSCYAKDISIDVAFQRDRSTEILQPLAQYEDINHTIHEIPVSQMAEGVQEGTFTFKIEKELFNNATASKAVKLNFLRTANQPIDPLDYKITKIKASLGSVTAEEMTNKKVTYLYARAYAPNQSSTGTKMQAKIFYEAYCKNADRNHYGLGGYPESVDNIYWYILPESETNGLDFSHVAEGITGGTTSGSVPGSMTVITSLFEKLEKMNKTSINIQAKKIPLRTRLSFQPEDYLVFDPYNASVTKHYFIISLTPKPKNWAGRGKIGTTVDTQISSRNYFDIIDW